MPSRVTRYTGWWGCVARRAVALSTDFPAQGVPAECRHKVTPKQETDSGTSTKRRHFSGRDVVPARPLRTNHRAACPRERRAAAAALDCHLWRCAHTPHLTGGHALPRHGAGAVVEAVASGPR